MAYPVESSGPIKELSRLPSPRQAKLRYRLTNETKPRCFSVTPAAIIVRTAPLNYVLQAGRFREPGEDGVEPGRLWDRS